MNFEVIKTYILCILVGLSLLLTFSLWNYNPRYDYLSDSDYLDEIDFGGEVLSKKEIIKPSTFVFKQGSNYYGFSNPKLMESLYHDMQSWHLENFQVGPVSKPPTNNEQVIIRFSDALPLEVLSSLTSLEDVEFPTWQFDTIYITLDTVRSTLQLQVMSTDGQKRVTATVNNATKFQLIQNYMNDREKLVDYVRYDVAEKPLFIPMDAVKMIRRPVTINTIPARSIVNALFNNPQSARRNVSPNVNEVYYTDGQRGLTIFQESRHMEFYNPIQAGTEQLDAVSLLDRSILNINEFKGWKANEYRLEKLNTPLQQISYRMHYEGYPVFSSNDITTIDQTWVNQELSLYDRPLFSLNYSFEGTQDVLPSGHEVIEFIEENDKYTPELISDIQIGYRLNHEDSTLYNYTLQPAWYMKYNGNWKEINISDDYMDRGVE